MLTEKTNFNIIRSQSCGISFGCNSKGLVQANKNFEKFIQKGKQIVEAQKSKVERLTNEYRAGLENNPDYITKKKVDIDRTIETIKNRYNTPVYDPRYELRNDNFKRLVSDIEDKAYNSDDYAARVTRYVLGDYPRIDNLEKVEEKLNYLQTQKKSSYLCVNKGYYYGISVADSMPTSIIRSMEDQIEKGLLDQFKNLADKGDLEAKLILWTRDDNSGLTHYNFKEAPDHLKDQLDMKVKHWGRKIELDGKDLGIDKSNLESIKPKLEKHIQTIRNGYADIKKIETSELIQNKLTENVKAKVLEYADNISKEMEKFENTPEMQEAKKIYEAKLREQNEKLANVNPRKEATEQFETHVAGYMKDSMTEAQKEIYKKEQIPRQLDYWVRVGECSPKRIVLTNPKPRTFDIMTNKRGFGGSASIDKDSGDIILEFKEGNKGFFKNIEFKGKDSKDIEHFEITEAKPDGSEETYDLFTGCKTSGGNDCIKLRCSSGNESVIEYGEAKPFEMAVRKPVIVFRGFSKETSLSINVKFSGNYKVIYPKEVNRDGQTISWTGKVVSNNQIEIENKKYPYLFWDGLLSDMNFDFSQSYCISGDNVISFLENKCSQYGLDNSITTDFVTFWAPYLQENKYNLIKFLSEEECNKVATLNIKSDSTEPINIIRFYMIFKAVDKMENLPEPQLSKSVINTSIPMIIDWGGFQQGRVCTAHHLE